MSKNAYPTRLDLWVFAMFDTIVELQARTNELEKDLACAKGVQPVEKLIPAYYATAEGADWEPWPGSDIAGLVVGKPLYFPQIGVKVHAFRFADGRRWDCVYGWRPSLTQTKEHSDGSTASYYVLPKGATQLQCLISHRNMNAQIGEIFRACYRMGHAAHSDEIRDVKKIIFYAQAELKRLEALNVRANLGD